MSRLRLTEPVRLYLYGVAGAALALLIGIGVLSSSTGALVGGVAVAVLSVPLTEITRASVYAPDTVDLINAGKRRRATDVGYL